MDFVRPGGTDAAVALLGLLSPNLTDAIAESRADFVWFYNPYPVLLKIPVLQNETILKPDDHMCRGRAGKMPVPPKDDVRIPSTRAVALALQRVIPDIPTQLQGSGRIQEL